MIAIRSANANDAPVINALIRELDLMEQMLKISQLAEETLRDWLATGQIGCLLAYCGDEAVGFALYYFTYSTFRGQKGLYLEDLYVKPVFRKRGLGKAFFVELAKLAIAENCFRIDWLVLSWNRNGIDFYNTLGARAVDDWILYRLTGPALSAVK